MWVLATRAFLLNREEFVRTENPSSSRVRRLGCQVSGRDFLFSMLSDAN
jgi:hypothetical protein